MLKGRATILTGRARHHYPGQAGFFKPEIAVQADDETVAQAIRRMAAGERAALSDLYRLEADRMFGLLLRMVRDRPTASDLLHDAFVKLWTVAPRFDPARGAARGWITTVVRNLAIDHLRRTGPQQHQPLEEDRHAAAEPAAEERLIRRQTATRLERCIEALPEERRRILLRAQLDHLSYAELSGALGVPVNTIKSWVRRALLQLRHCLGTEP